MHTKEIQTHDEYLQLIEKANTASSAYYDNDNPIMTDAEFDELMQSIKNYEMRHHTVAENSPTQKVGGSTGKSTFAKVIHAVPMKSLQDVFNYEDLAEFLAKFEDDDAFAVEEKIDGLSLSVTYENGVLTRAETRGDGYIGEDVTENALCIFGIPHILLPNYYRDDIKTLEVRCEVYLSVSEFERLNKSREGTSERVFKNPRNAAAGILRTKDTNVVKEAHLCAFAFNVQRIEFNDNGVSDPGIFERVKTHNDSMIILRELGFQTVNRVICDKYGVLTALEFFAKRREHLPYWIDGAVVKVNSFELRNKIGETSKYPLWAFAYKYPPEEKATVIRDIILQTGRTGRVTPVALLEPVTLGGTTVSRATLNNPEFIKALEVNIGDTVLIRKAAEIIPEIVKVVEKRYPNNSVNPPDVYDIFEHACPSCGGHLVPGTDEDGNEVSGAYCNNPDCPAQIARKFEFWASRDCMDIRGFGPAIVDKFIAEGWLKTLPDIYRLKDHRDEMINLDGYGEKKADNILAAIEESKDRDIDRLIKALGIEGIGRHIGKELSKRYASMFRIGVADIKELESIDGVGRISAQAIYDAFHKRTISDMSGESDMLLMLNELNALGVNMLSKAYSTTAVNKGSVLNGKTFVITGTLPSMKREDATSLIEANGGKVSGSVSKKTDYLLCGENAGSKLDKANSLGVKVISEADLTNMLI